MTLETIAFCLTHGREHADDETEEDYTDLVPHGEYATITQCAEDLRPVVPGTVVSVNETASDSEVTEPTFTLKAGDLAFIETVRGGLVPCKVLTLDWTGADVLVTASRPGWNRGDVEHFINPAVTLVHRGQVKRYKDGTTWITGSLIIQASDSEGTSA